MILRTHGDGGGGSFMFEDDEDDYDSVLVEEVDANQEDDEDIISEAEDTPTILSKYIDSLDIKADKKQLENCFLRYCFFKYTLFFQV